MSDPQCRQCLNCGSLVWLPVAERDRPLVVRAACEQCGDLSRLRPLEDAEPHWLVDGRPEPAPNSLQEVTA